jgi:acyl carrier protein
VNTTDTTSKIKTIIDTVAPGCGVEDVEGDADLREELDLDSMDFLSILVAIKEQLGVEVPERDYPQVRTLDALVAYVEAPPAQSPSAG